MTNSPFSNQGVWRIAAPMILSNISLPLLGLVDTAVMGHLDSAVYLGAVAVGATIFSFIFTGLNFLRMGTTGIAAQAHGSGDATEMRTVLAQAALIAIGMALLLLVLRGPIASAAMLLLKPSSEVAGFATEYFSIRIWSAPAVLINFAVIGWFIGMQNARGPLAIMLTVNLTNILLDFVFVIGLGLKVDGVAIASVIAEYGGLCLSGVLVAREIRRIPGRWEKSRIFDSHRFHRLFSVNANLLIRTFALMFVFGFLTAQGARMGNAVLAANALLLNFQLLMSYGLDGFAHAAEALVGRAIGARDREGFVTSIRISLRWSLFVAVAFTLIYAVAGPVIIRIISDIPEVVETAFEYLPWLILSPIVSVWSFLYDGVYVGATRAREMRNSMLLSAFLVYVPAYYALEFLGNHGLWLAFMLFMAARGISMHWIFKRLDARNEFAPL